MTDHKPGVKLLAFVGLAGSGKSAAAAYLTEKNYPKVYFGDIMHKAMIESGINPGDWDRENTFRAEVRGRKGKDFVVKQAIQEIHGLIGAGQRRVVLDGLYTWTEYKLLKHEFPGELAVVAVVSPKHLRKLRMAKRHERPMTSEQVDERDWSEIETIEKGGPIAIADYFIHNDGAIEKLHAEIDALLGDIDFV